MCAESGLILMWWRICGILLVLVLFAAAALMLTAREQTAEIPLPSDASALSARGMESSDDETVGETAVLTPEPCDEPAAESDPLEVISGSVEFSEWDDWRALYADLTHFPDAKLTYEIDDRMVKDQYRVSNDVGEFMILGCGRIAYSESWSEENKSALQLYEMIADTLGALWDETLLQAQKDTHLADLDGFSRQEAERMAAEWVSANLPPMYDGVVALDEYGFSETRLSELHEALRASDLIYPFHEQPLVPEGGVYYVELTVTIDGKPVVAQTRGRELRLRFNTVTSTCEYSPLDAYVIVSKQGVIHAELSTLFSATGEMETARAITAEEAMMAYRGLMGYQSASPETQLQYAIARRGTGKAAKYALKPVWHVFEEDDDGGIASGYYFDALTGEHIWEIYDIPDKER